MNLICFLKTKLKARMIAPTANRTMAMRNPHVWLIWTRKNWDAPLLCLIKYSTLRTVQGVFSRRVRDRRPWRKVPTTNCNEARHVPESGTAHHVQSRKRPKKEVPPTKQNWKRMVLFFLSWKNDGCLLDLVVSRSENEEFIQHIWGIP